MQAKSNTLLNIRKDPSISGEVLGQWLPREIIDLLPEKEIVITPEHTWVWTGGILNGIYIKGWCAREFLTMIVIPVDSQVFIVDDSGWKNPDLKLLQSGGVFGIIHKATNGSQAIGDDSTYQSSRDSTLALGMQVGAFHFGTGNSTGLEQAQHFLKVVQPTHDTVIALDLESNRLYGPSMDQQQA
jgi:hypothetical protein